MSRRLATITTSLYCLTTTLLAVAAPPAFQSDSDFDAFVHGYYLAPQPELVSPAIDYLGARGVLKKKSAVAPVVAFFAEVFSRNADRLPDWTVAISRQPEEVRAALALAQTLARQPTKILDDSPSGRRNDMCWGAFFASGDDRYLVLLLQQVNQMNERENLDLFLAAASAKWSLASNARNHPAVKAAVQSARDAASGPIAQELEDILRKEPKEILEETTAVVQEQRKKGKW